jgi:D-alanyl-D-alanine carboxypeptidase (penicillin-binding protein 5/6)
LHYARRRRSRWWLPATILLLIAVAGYEVLRTTAGDDPRDYLAADQWPTKGQASITVGSSDVESSPAQAPVPIASIAKVMTAYLVLRAAPLDDGDDGFRFTVTEADVADTASRRHNDESVVAVRAGEVLTERQALLALLLPSANNVAIMLAQHVDGSIDAFVQEMNQTAETLDLADTTYTDPSGLDEGTRSTAADQVRLANVAMREPGFPGLVATGKAQLPVAGTVRNTDTLLGTAGFVGIKTGSDDAAGGCFMFRTHRVIDGHSVEVTGVVLGQPGRDLIAAGLAAAAQLADRVAPAA